MENVHQHYEQYIFNGSVGEIYKKLQCNEDITIEEFEKLINVVKSDIFESNINIVDDNYIKLFKTTNTSHIWKDCKNIRIYYDHQEYDEFGSIDEPEVEKSSYCSEMGEYEITPKITDIVILTFLLNLLENSKVINLICNNDTSYYEQCFDKIIEYCETYNIVINKKINKNVLPQKITFHRFKTFEYYYKKIFGYSLILNK